MHARGGRRAGGACIYQSWVPPRGGYQGTPLGIPHGGPPGGFLGENVDPRWPVRPTWPEASAFFDLLGGVRACLLVIAG